MIDGSYRFKGYGGSVRVDAPVDITLAELQSKVAPELSAEECAEGLSDLHLTRWNGEYHLTHGERRYGPYRTLHNALRGLSNAIHFVIGKRSPLTFLHAGAVEIEGSAVVFPGRSRWGKSTLVSSLVEQGCGYLSDEYAVISPEGAVFPLSKPIRLRGGAARGNDALEVNHTGASAPGGFPCAAVILTRFQDGAAWDPRPLTSGEAALEILPTALQSREEPAQVLCAISALAANAVCYQSFRSSGEPTSTTIRSLMGIRNPGKMVRA
jgi:hypothetical protein